MRNNSSRAGLHRYKRNLLFPFFALIFALPNLIGSLARIKVVYSSSQRQFSLQPSRYTIDLNREFRTWF